MTSEEIAGYAEKLRLEAEAIPEVSMSNYKAILAQYKRMLNDVIVLIRELAIVAIIKEKIDD